jgi:hypothetical protein
MSCGPYGDAAELPAVLDVLDVLDALGAEEPVADEVAPAAELGATAAVNEESEDCFVADPGVVAAPEPAGAELPAAVAEADAVEVAAVELAAVESDGTDDAPVSSPPARAW